MARCSVGFGVSIRTGVPLRASSTTVRSPVTVSSGSVTRVICSSSGAPCSISAVQQVRALLDLARCPRRRASSRVVRLGLLAEER